MSKNTGATKFRKVDVDQYDPDKYSEDVTEGEESNEGPNESTINNFLAQIDDGNYCNRFILSLTGKNVDALLEVLEKAPAGAKNQALKDRVVQSAIRVMTSFKTSEIEGAVKKIDQKDSKLIDVLMKYVYKGFEYPEDGSSASLLAWHEKVYACGGAGCIIRVLTDRKRV